MKSLLSVTLGLLVVGSMSPASAQIDYDKGPPKRGAANPQAQRAGLRKGRRILGPPPRRMHRRGATGRAGVHGWRARRKNAQGVHPEPMTRRNQLKDPRGIGTGPFIRKNAAGKRPFKRPGGVAQPGTGNFLPEGMEPALVKKGNRRGLKRPGKNFAMPGGYIGAKDKKGVNAEGGILGPTGSKLTGGSNSPIKDEGVASNGTQGPSR